MSLEKQFDQQLAFESPRKYITHFFEGKIIYLFPDLFVKRFEASKNKLCNQGNKSDN